MSQPGPATPNFRRTRWELAGVLVLAMAAVGLGIFALGVIRGWIDNDPDLVPFESSGWQASPLGGVKHGMALSLVEEGTLLGLTQAEVEARLGTPFEPYSRTAGMIQYQLEYFLGGDYRLTIRFGSDGRVASTDLSRFVWVTSLANGQWPMANGDRAPGTGHRAPGTT